jgi:hypothetical protein
MAENLDCSQFLKAIAVPDDTGMKVRIIRGKKQLVFCWQTKVYTPSSLLLTETLCICADLYIVSLNYKDV